MTMLVELSTRRLEYASDNHVGCLSTQHPFASWSAMSGDAWVKRCVPRALRWCQQQRIGSQAQERWPAEKKSLPQVSQLAVAGLKCHGFDAVDQVGFQEPRRRRPRRRRWTSAASKQRESRKEEVGFNMTLARTRSHTNAVITERLTVIQTREEECWGSHTGLWGRAVQWTSYRCAPPS